MAQGMIMGELDRHDEAIEVLQDALDRARVGDRVTPELLNNVAMAHVGAGRPDDGLDPAEEAVRVARRIGDRHQEPMTLDTVGLVHLHARRPGDAVRAFEEALAACEHIWPTILKPSLLLNLGLAQRAQDRTGAARRSWIEALRLLDDLDAPDSDELSRARLRNLIDDPDGTPDAPITRSG
jgi:tetratricopeptide (TPR) repeat protein